VAADIADGAFTSVKFADGFLTAAKIAGDAITEAKIADTTFREEHFNNGALSELKFGDNFLTSNKIATNAIDGDAIALTAVTEIQSGLASASSLAITQGQITTVQNSVDGLPTTVSTAVFNWNVFTGFSFLRLIRALGALASGKSNGHTGAGGTVNFRDPGDTQNQIVSTLDADGNRTSVTIL